MCSATYCGYGVSLILVTISPSIWYPRLQYFSWVFGGTAVKISLTRSRLRAATPW